jgi:membrane-associated phospholipid phosphatase
MTVDQHELYVGTRTADASFSGAARRFFRELAPQDFIVFTYLTILNTAVFQSQPGAARNFGLASVSGLIVLHIVMMLAVRTRWFTNRYLMPLVYRVVTYGCVQVTYFFFAQILPLVNPRALDHQLYQFDLTYFGVEPAVYLDRFVNPVTTEWFAFFYFSYFLVLALHVLPILFASRNSRALSEFALGMIILFCIGHTFYMLVPGYGPYKAMPELFAHRLNSGIWWNTTTDLVARSGAQKDIFPSLHTAAPTFLLLFSYHRRAELPFKYTWPVVAFFAANIVIATMFLRWHYVIDVVAGLCLALLTHVLTVRLTSREMVRREALGLGAPWPQWGVEPEPHYRARA